MAGAKSRGEEEEDGWVSIELVSRDERGVGCCERDDELWCAWGAGWEDVARHVGKPGTLEKHIAGL